MSIMDPQSYKITRVRIGLLPTAPRRLRDVVEVVEALDGAYPPDDENNYWADVIQDGPKFYYRVDDTTVEINSDEYHKVIANPSLYYFSTALKLHHRMRKAPPRDRATLPEA